MITTFILAAVLAEGTEAQPIRREEPSTRIVMPVPEGTMTCTKEGDRLVCVLPLQKEVVDTAEPAMVAANPAPPKAQPYKRTPSTPALPDPQVLGLLKEAKDNIALAQALLPKAKSPEEAVLAQQLLYWAKEQYRTSKALQHTQQEDLRRAPDPFEAPSSETSLQSM
jgi:hypothetical protein